MTRRLQAWMLVGRGDGLVRPSGNEPVAAEVLLRRGLKLWASGGRR